MKKLLLAGNWKSNKTIEEAREWLRQFITNSPIVLCAPFTALSTLNRRNKRSDDKRTGGLGHHRAFLEEE